MNILFLSDESPIFPAGGIGVYIGYMAEALAAAGHRVFLLTWRQRAAFVPPASHAPFHPENVHVEIIDPQEMMQAHAPRPYPEAVSHRLADRVIELADRWSIDVIESTDFHAPGMIAFQRLQTGKDAARRLLTTFNHGLHEIIYAANQTFPPPEILANINTERRVMRASDLMIAPSAAASGLYRGLGIDTPVEILREPYVFRTPAGPAAALTGNIQYHGRLSVQKGLDRLARAANIINAVAPVGRIDLIGNAPATPFGGQPALDLLRARLEPELAERVVHHAQQSRQAVLDLLEPGALAPHLGSSETFSYACVEAIDAGAIPILREGTAMAEFLPPELRHLAFDEDMRSTRELQRKTGMILENAGRIAGAVRAHCEATLRPDIVAARLADIYAGALERKRGYRLHPAARRDLGVDDMSILIPVMATTTRQLEPTLASVAAQMVQPPKVILCLDGNGLKIPAPAREVRQRLARAQIVRQVKSGEPAVLNSLIELCRTELALILNPGLRLSPHAVTRLVQAWNALPRPVDALILPMASGCRPDEIAHKVLPAMQARRLDELRGQAALIRTRVLREIGFDASRRNGERLDWAFWLDFAARGHVAAILPDRDLLSGAPDPQARPPMTEGAWSGTMSMLARIDTRAAQVSEGTPE